MLEALSNATSKVQSGAKTGTTATEEDSGVIISSATHKNHVRERDMRNSYKSPNDLIEITSAKFPSNTRQQHHCPNCYKEVQRDHINTHLDFCLRGDSSIRTVTTSPRRSYSITTQAHSDRTRPTPGSYSNLDDPAGRALPSASHIIKDPCKRPATDKIPIPHFRSMRDDALRKLCRDVGISTLGDKHTLRERYVEYRRRHNTNADSESPVSLVQVRAELEQWERGFYEDRRLNRTSRLKTTEQMEVHAMRYSDEFTRLKEAARDSLKRAHGDPGGGELGNEVEQTKRARTDVRESTPDTKGGCSAQAQQASNEPKGSGCSG